MAKIAFKSDNQKQSMLLPPSLDELIPATHSVRVVDTIIDRLDVDDILRTYRGGGNSCFHPGQMLKILVYAYLNNIYSSRRIANSSLRTSTTCGFQVVRSPIFGRSTIFAANA